MTTQSIESGTLGITAAQLEARIKAAGAPIVVDVRKAAAFRASATMVSGALHRDPAALHEWAGALPAASAIVVYCVHGHEVSQGAAAELRERGIDARFLAGGITAWNAAGGVVDAKPQGAATRWVTRERPKIDRIACPWLVKRFVDPDAEFLYVPSAQVLATAREREAIPYDVPDVHFTHEGERCSFDAFVTHYRLADPALAELAAIVRAADTGMLGAMPQAAGLAAISLGLSRNFADDHEMLERGLVMYDALYTWCRGGKDEVHTWNPQAYR